MVSATQRRQLLGLALLTLALFTALSLVPLPADSGAFPEGNIMGVVGDALERAGYALLGAGLLLLPIVLAVGGAVCFGWIDAEDGVRWGSFAAGLMLLAPGFAALVAPGSIVGPVEFLPAGAPGWVGRTLAEPLAALLGWIGVLLVLVVLFLALCIATLGWNPLSSLFEALRRPRDSSTAEGAEDAEEEDEADLESEEFAPEEVIARVVKRVKPKKRERARPEPEVLPVPEGADELPTVDLLSEPPNGDGTVSEGELNRLGETLIRTLRTFRVEGELGGRTTGPVVTQFEVIPAPGVKVNRIAALDADLALALHAPSIRIVAPIPGKGVVGVEVPNPEREMVYLRRILESPAFQRARGTLPLALGKDLTGKPYVADLAAMPHLLIAGATGSGKSICINTLITSLIYRHTPMTMRLLLIDPKMVELSMYGDLPHLRHPVVTNPQDAATALRWAVLEMERRYRLLSENGVRSLLEFNRRIEAGDALRRAEPGPGETDEEKWAYQDGLLPYIVVVVDELADLMMSVQAEIERPLAQLAQKARAIGIHLIVATQRPSVNVITGLIKANFPCRIGFRVSSKVDSRTILDQNGADALLGHGDMLFLPPGTSDPVRIQGAYLSTEDTDRLMRWYRERAHAREREDDILEFVRSREGEPGDEDVPAYLEARDPLFRQAAEVCIQLQQGSTSQLQRRLGIGYGRAARIIDQLEHAGVLGPPNGSKPREVLIGLDSLEHVLGED